MLYDPKWEKPKIDLYDTKNFAAWLQTQPKNKRYEFTSVRHCAVAQYLQANGVSERDSIMDGETMDRLGWTEIVILAKTFGRAAMNARLSLEPSKIKRFFIRAGLA